MMQNGARPAYRLLGTSRQLPKLKEHIAQHEDFRTKMTALQTKAIILDVSAEMVEFLGDWLVDHIASSDKEIVLYLKK